jgi:hypothetical protein
LTKGILKRQKLHLLNYNKIHVLKLEILLSKFSNQKKDSAEFIIWECFENEIQKHLNSKHLKDFLKLGLVEFVKGYVSFKI